MSLKVDIPELETLSDKVSIAQDKVVTEFNQVSDVINDLINMESFSGDAADSAKGYYQNIHQTVIFAFQQLMIDIDNNLRNHLDIFHTEVDTSNIARIKAEYADNVREDIEINFQSLEDTDREVVQTIDDVSDIIIVTKPDLHSPKSDKEDIVKLINELIANLENYTSTDNTMVKEMIAHVKNLMKEIQTYSGEERFKNVEKSDLIDNLLEMMMNENGMFGNLMEKLAKDEALTPKEQALLYNFFQNILLTNEAREEVEEVTNLISEKNIDKLKERLNDKVVYSRKSLEREIAIIQAYLYMGNLTPGQTNISIDDRAKLEAYLMLINGYEETMGDNNVIMVHELDYKENRNDIPGHHFFSALKRYEYNVDEKIMNEQEFRDYMFDPNNPIVDVFTLSEINYYVGTNAVSDKLSQELAELKDEQANYTSTFIAGKVVDKLISEAASAAKVGELVSILKAITEHNQGNAELTNQITVEEGMVVADRLGMELGISETRDIPGSATPNVDSIQLTPTDKTFEILERWKQVHEEFLHVDFPADSIDSQDWYQLGESLNDIKLKEGTKVSNYILDGVLPEGETIEDLIDEQ